ncbi:MAG: ATP phosphoribosyltransferase regulatory subunit [Pyrinomonadaceae bacterium]
MSDSPSTIPLGTRYYFGLEAQLRRTVEHLAMSVFNGWSYEEITTPTVDYYNLFERGMGRLEAQRAFRFTDVDGRLLALRPDVTSSIARAVATLMAKRKRPLRFCYAAPVFRLRGESHADWRRESTQIGCELIGSNRTAADMEVLAIASEIFSCLGLDGSYTITINDLELFNGVAESLELDSAAREEMRQLVDAHNAPDLKRFLADHAADEGQAFTQLVQLSGKGEVIDEARPLVTNYRSRAALERLELLWRIIESLGLSNHFEIDLGDVSRLDYYTGIVFKIYIAGAGSRVGSGGRYDQLTASFGKAEPAVGFVLDLDALADAFRSVNKDELLTGEEAKKVLPLSHEDPATLFREALRRRAQKECIVLASKEVTACQT